MSCCCWVCAGVYRVRCPFWILIVLVDQDLHSHHWRSVLGLVVPYRVWGLLVPYRVWGLLVPYSVGELLCHAVCGGFLHCTVCGWLVVPHTVLAAFGALRNVCGLLYRTVCGWFVIPYGMWGLLCRTECGGLWCRTKWGGLLYRTVCGGLWHCTECRRLAALYRAVAIIILLQHTACYDGNCCRWFLSVSYFLRDLKENVVPQRLFSLFSISSMVMSRELL